MHDQTIDDRMAELLPSPCLRKFVELEMYFCYGCYYNETVSIKTKEKTISLCVDFARRIWGVATSNLLEGVSLLTNF